MFFFVQVTRFWLIITSSVPYLEGKKSKKVTFWTNFNKRRIFNVSLIIYFLLEVGSVFHLKSVTSSTHFTQKFNWKWFNHPINFFNKVIQTCLSTIILPALINKQACEKFMYLRILLYKLLLKEHIIDPIRTVAPLYRIPLTCSNKNDNKKVDTAWNMFSRDNALKDFTLYLTNKSSDIQRMH